jgi:hypothetical protein
MKCDQLSGLMGENKAPYIENLGSGQLVVGNSMEQNERRDNFQTETMWPNW